MPTPRETWAEQQIAELLASGDSLEDAQRVVSEILSMIPPEADPATYELDPEQIMTGATPNEQDVAAARTDWYLSPDVPSEFKRLLDAKAT